MEDSAGTATATATPARFTRGEPVTVIVNGTADDEYTACAPGGRTYLMLATRLDDGRLSVPCDYPGITVIHGDIRPTLLQALKDAIEYRDCRSSDECAGWRENYEKAIDVLGAAE